MLHPTADAPSLPLQQATAWQFCQDPEGWGPFNSRRFDFTPCAEHTLLFGLPAFVATLLFAIRIRKLRNSHVRAFRFGRTGWILYGTQICIGAAIGALVSVITSYWQLPHHPSRTPTFLFGVFSMTLAWTAAGFLNLQEHKYSTRSSDLLFAFYVYSLLASGVIYSTLDSTTTPETEKSTTILLGHFKILLCSLGMGFVIEASPRTETTVQILARKLEHQTLDEQANLYSRLTFHYLDPLMKLGVQRPLIDDDVPELIKECSLTEPSGERIGHAWRKAVQSHQDSGRQPPSLLMTLFSTGWWRIFSVCVIRAISVVFKLSTPICLKYILLFVQQRSEAAKNPNQPPQPDEPLWPIRFGVFLAIAILVLNAASSILSAYSILQSTLFGMEVRSGLIQLIYLKSLVLSPQARQANTTGAIVNRMSIDTEKWLTQFQLITWLMIMPFELGFGIVLLFRTVGISFLAGFAVLLMIAPIQRKMGTAMSNSEHEKLEYMDKRMRLMTEILSGIKIIKLYGWEEAFRNKVGEIRNKEIKALRYLSTIRAILTIVFTSTTLIMALATFTCYALIGGPGFTPGKMTADVVFVAISLFGMISAPLGMASHCYMSFVSIRVSTNRVQELLLAEEVEQVVERFPRASLMPGETPQNSIAIEFHNATLAWTKETSDKDTSIIRRQAGQHATESDERQPLLQNEHGTTKAGNNDKPALRNIQLKVIESTLTAIVGRVGQGKSSLLAALTGEMYKREGSIKVYGTIAYVPQHAWIVHGTLRDNILFGKPFDQVKYDRIIHASGLLPDLAMLPAGDRTEIGERGINLSGGQKQRVSLARAAYQDADIYLMDDPLSAVDAHVDQHLWEHLIGPDGLLQDKTRLLVTHGIHHLEQVDHIVLLKDGQISEQGHYYELLDAQKAFYQLICDFQVAGNGDKKRESRRKKAEESHERSMNKKDDASQHSASQLSDETEESGETQQGDAVQTRNDGQNVDENGDEEGTGALIEAEKLSEGIAGWSLYKEYAKACSYRNVVYVLSLFTAARMCHVGTNIWLKYWIDTTEKDTAAGREPRPVSFYLSFYAFLVLMFLTVDVTVNYVTMVVAGLRAAVLLHDELLKRVMRLPMSFFDTTPLGRVINRFSSDTSAIDTELPWELNEFFAFFFEVSATALVISVSTPVFLLLMPPAILAYFHVQNYFIKTSVSLKKISQVTKSPLYSHFAETLTGVSSIRVMEGAQDRFIAINVDRANRMAQRTNTYLLLNRWLQVRLETLGAFMVSAAALLAIWNAEKLDPALVGLTLSYALSVMGLINYLVRTIGQIQNAMVNFERVQEYSNMPTEAPAKSGIVLPDHWPQQGHVIVRDYSTRYREGHDLVLRHVSFEVLPGQKVGIVGRTGAGKSSLTLGLFRIIEAANSYWARTSQLGHGAAHDQTIYPKEHRLFASSSTSPSRPLSENVMDGGSIIIDGVDIATMGLDDLRQRLAIIPQDPTLFAGTLRENLDPFHELEDFDLWKALERAHLKTYVSALPQGLMHEVAANGENFSVGQRQLICLARALLRKTKVLVLDEATSSVDMQTDELIQQTIRTEFADRTILTIAHRIKTVMDYDMILVLEKGQVLEYASPAELLQKQDSLFYGLAKQAGEI